MTVRIWIDVEDLFEYCRANPRPSGIQRLAFELCRALYERDGGSGNVRFVRHDPLRNDLRMVPWTDVAVLFQNLAALPRQRPMPAQSVQPHGRAGTALRKLVYRLPSELRAAFLAAWHEQRKAFLAWRALALSIGASGSGALARTFAARRKRRGAKIVSGGGADFPDLAAAGDVLLVVGAPWFDPNFAGFIAAQRKQRGLRFALLVYDLIPIRCPEWCDPGLVRLFRSWLDGVLPLCDHPFSISKYTAMDLESYARGIGIHLPRRVVPVPLGTGLPGGGMRSERLPPAGTYALCVSTIEARKNHVLLFRVWRRLLECNPAAAVPKLVFAGRVGWLVSDLMQQIANTGGLAGNLLVIEDPADSELVALYQGCLFTLFPSLYEGWGLPVSESLAFGKPCLIADRTSLPEAGGDLVRRFNPDSLDDAYHAIRGVIDDRAGLEAWTARVRHQFRPVPWSATADALVKALHIHAEPGTETAHRGEELQGEDVSIA